MSGFEMALVDQQMQRAADLTGKPVIVRLPTGALMAAFPPVQMETDVNYYDSLLEEQFVYLDRLGSQAAPAPERDPECSGDHEGLCLSQLVQAAPDEFLTFEQVFGADAPEPCNTHSTRHINGECACVDAPALTCCGITFGGDDAYIDYSEHRADHEDEPEWCDDCGEPARLRRVTRMPNNLARIELSCAQLGCADLRADGNYAEPVR